MRPAVIFENWFKPIADENAREMSRGLAKCLPWLRRLAMSRRPTQRRHSSWERITIHPRRDRKKIDALKGDMVRAYMKGDLETCWKLDRELRWILTQGKSG